MASDIEHMDTICRHASESGASFLWQSYGSMGWIEAAQKHANYIDAKDGARIEVRDRNDESRPPAIFTVRREVKYIVTNPRQGAD